MYGIGGVSFTSLGLLEVLGGDTLIVKTSPFIRVLLDSPSNRSPVHEEPVTDFLIL